MATAAAKKNKKSDNEKKKSNVYLPFPSKSYIVHRCSRTKSDGQQQVTSMYNPFLRKFDTLPKTSYHVASVPDLLTGLFIACCGWFYRPRCWTTTQASCGASSSRGFQSSSYIKYLWNLSAFSRTAEQRFFFLFWDLRTKKISVWRGKICYFSFLILGQREK